MKIEEAFEITKPLEAGSLQEIMKDIDADIAEMDMKNTLIIPVVLALTIISKALNKEIVRLQDEHI